MNRQTLFLLAILLATGPSANAASFALDIFDGADFTGNVVGQATLSTTTGYPQLDTPGTTAVVPQLDQYDFTLTVNSLDPGYSGVDGLSVVFQSQGTVEFVPPDDNPSFLLVDPAFSQTCAGVPECTGRPVMLESPSGWTGSIGFHTQISSDGEGKPFVISRTNNALMEFQFIADDPANALVVGESLAGFRWKSWADAWTVALRDDSAGLYTAARGLEATSEEPAPIPEPTAFTLVGLGLAALVAVQRKRHLPGDNQ